MNNNIEIVYNKYLYNNHDKFISLIINNFQNKQILLNRNNKNKIRDEICMNISLIKLLDNNYCELCDKYADYYGYCINHYDQELINNYRITYIKDINSSNHIKSYFLNYYKEYINFIKMSKNNILHIRQHYFDKIYSTLNFTLQNNSKESNLKYINCDYNIDYNKLNVIFNDNIAIEIINDFYNNTRKKEQNIIILLIFLLKKYTYDSFIFNNLYENPSKNITKKTFIGNNNILYNHIYNSKIINNIEYMETEKLIHIDNHSLRIDIYIILKTFNDNYEYEYFELFIECDEQHHIHNRENNYDLLKDKYCITNNISLLRLNLDDNKLNTNDINFCLFFMEYLIKYKQSIYYFSDKYIHTHKVLLTKNDDIISFGSNNLRFNINKYNELNDIKNIDKLIKSCYLTSIIDKFSVKHEYNDLDNNIAEEEIKNILIEKNIYHNNSFINIKNHKYT